MRRQRRADLAFEKESVALFVFRARQRAVEAISDFVGRVIGRVRRDRQIIERFVGVVFNRKPDRLDIVARQVLAETAPAFRWRERGHADLQPRSGLALRARHEDLVRRRIRRDCVGMNKRGDHDASDDQSQICRPPAH